MISWGGAPWFSGTKHNNTCKPHSCGTLSLWGLSFWLSHTPDAPFPPFQTSPSFPRNMTSHYIRQSQRYYLGRVLESVCECVFEVYISVCKWVPGKETVFCVNGPFERFWVEHRRLHPSFTFFPPLDSADFSCYLQDHKNVRRQNNLQNRISLTLLTSTYIKKIRHYTLLDQQFTLKHSQTAYLTK